MTDSDMTTHTDIPHDKVAAVAEPEADEFLRREDRVFANGIGAHPDVHPRAWTNRLPLLGRRPSLIDGDAGQLLSNYRVSAQNPRAGAALSLGVGRSYGS